MQVQSTETSERRSQSHNLIQELIDTRTEMLSLLGKMASNKPFLEEGQADTLELLQEFCEILVDYTANAHFRIYRYIDENIEKRRSVLELAERIYPPILETTRIIVNFNDKYESLQKGQLPASLEADLSLLGERLAERIELEDQLITELSRPRIVRRTAS
jgi:regulator of sigma D